MKSQLSLFVVAALSVGSLGAQPAGLVDTAFRPALGERKPDAVVPLADGRLYVTGNGMTFSIGNRTQRNLARLNRDGSIDPTFAPGADLDIPTLVNQLKAGPGIHYPFLPSDTGAPLSLLVQRDGRLVLYLAYSEFALRTTFRNEVALARINPDGLRDHSFGTYRDDLDTDTRYFTQRDSTPAELPIVLADGRLLKISFGQDS
ncbi:MAG: delta-60 repeat domain-containing protein, partial [Opitutaceae bacterium]|nr:delta-60 repeat domain-containing protein [Opitutaceae bacterium]